MNKYDFDLFVIGAGSGGVRLARMAANKGAKVAVAEDRYLGGTCVNVGCVPKKLFVYASEYAEHFEESQGFGWSSSGKASFHWPTLRDRKTAEIKRLNGIYKNLLDGSGTQIMEGRARIAGQHLVEVNGQQYSAKNIVIATGGWPFVPRFEGHELAITSNELFYLDKLPSQAVVLGGGYIAIEMAGILNGLGVETTLVYRGDLFLRGFDEDIRQFVKTEIEKKGISLRFKDNISKISSVSEGNLEVSLESGDTLETGLVLAATGRVPNIQDIGLDTVSVALDPKGNIIVDEHYLTSEPGIYAIGDVIGGMQLTPVALAEGMFLSEYLFGEKENARPVDYENIPTAVFCQPNIGTVGLSEEMAREKGYSLDIYRSEFKPMRHTLSESDERCLMKLVVDKTSQKVLGVHMVGHEAGEIVQGIAIALKAGATKDDFDRTIGIHPTSAEEFVTMRTPVLP